MIKNTEGDIYKLSGPNRLMNDQTVWSKKDKIQSYNIENLGKEHALPGKKIKEFKYNDLIKKSQEEIISKEIHDKNKEIIDEIEEKMTIKNPDGTNYEAKGKDALKSYRPGSPDIKLMDKWDKEQIELAGSPIIYYKVFIDQDYDDVYMETMDKVTTQNGFKLYAQFEPIKPAQDLSSFGIDSPDELKFIFNLTEWKSIVGEMPTVGGLFFLEWDQTWWEIIQGNQDEPYQLWNKFRLSVTTKKYQPSRGDHHPTRRDATDHNGNIDLSLNKIIY